MKKMFLLAILLLLNGCALNRLFLFDEIDKVNVVKYTAHVKIHRAYFTRTDLKPIIHNKRYLFLYHPQLKTLSILLRKADYFLLYDLTSPQKEVQHINIDSLHTLLRYLREKGYYQVNHLQALGFEVKIGKRRYKHIKTLMVELYDYRILQSLYHKAIQKYRYDLVSSVKEKLPVSMIEPYFRQYEENATTPSQQQALIKIAKKLGVVSKLVSTTSLQTPSTQESEEIEPLYPYYLHHASLDELQKYLDSPKSQQELNDGERTMLIHRLQQLKQEKILQEAPLETLIAEYQKNKDPRFKARILERIKTLQKN